MTRLIDRIFSSRVLKGSAHAKDSTWQSLQSAPVIVADNVAQYYFFGSEKDIFGPKDIPNVAPPFDSFFIEFRMPSRINNGGEIEKTGPLWLGSEIGVLAETLVVEGSEDAYKELSISLGDPWPEIGKWILHGCVFVYLQENLMFPMAFYMAIDANGEIILTRNTHDGDDIIGGCLAGQWAVALSDRRHMEFMHVVNEQFHPLILTPILLTISFMHCKNVSMQREVPPIPLSKKYARKEGRALVSYRTLNIEPMKKVLRTEGNSEKTGLKQALHICRGHFKDFSKGKGLFGKYKGLYWWDSAVRGSVSEGIVDKDYAVKSPV